MHNMLNIAIRAARKAGNFIAKSYERQDLCEIGKKGNKDFVKKVYREAERLIIEVINNYYPQHTVMSEECEELVGSDSNVQWMINGLDGTNNFIKRIPHFAVSIAGRNKGRTEIAVVYDPMRNELFSATLGQGAKLNSYRMRCCTYNDIDSTILATSFPLKPKQHLSSSITLIKKLLLQCADFRRTGSTALDLAYVAAGRVDGFFAIGIKHWDFVGCELLTREAGCLFTDFTCVHNNLLYGNIVAGNPHVVKSILLMIRENIS